MSATNQNMGKGASVPRDAAPAPSNGEITDAVALAAVRAALEAGADERAVCALIDCVLELAKESDDAQEVAGYGVIGRLVAEGDFFVAPGAAFDTPAPVPATEGKGE